MLQPDPIKVECLLGCFSGPGTTATGKAFWQWFASHGELAGFAFSDSEEIAEGRVLRYRLVLGENPFWLSVKVNRDDKIAQICWW